MDDLVVTGIEQLLRAGLVRRDRHGLSVTYRFLSPTDDVAAITRMLHGAYGPLAAAGMRYVASYQTVEVTRRRMARGDTLVAVVEGRLIGVVTLARASDTSGSPHYDRPDVASFGQFAVEPAFQQRGIGSALVSLVEQLARLRGVAELALDTSEQAAQLVRYYTSRGYRFVECVRWQDVNYRSRILSKPLGDFAGGT